MHSYEHFFYLIAMLSWLVSASEPHFQPQTPLVLDIGNDMCEDLTAVESSWISAFEDGNTQGIEVGG